MAVKAEVNTNVAVLLIDDYCLLEFSRSQISHRTVQSELDPVTNTRSRTYAAIPRERLNLPFDVGRLWVNAV